MTSKAGGLSDEELALRVADGALPLFEELVIRYSSRLFYFLRQRAGTDQDIEDLVQETFFKALRYIGRFESRAKFSTWLFTIASRQAISHHRKKRTRTRVPVPVDSHFHDFPDSSRGPEEIMIKKQESCTIWELAGSLKQNQYEALWLYYAEEMTIKEMARIMKKKPIAVRILLHRARLSLGQKLNSSEYADKISGTSQARQNLSFIDGR